MRKKYVKLTPVREARALPIRLPRPVEMKFRKGEGNVNPRGDDVRAIGRQRRGRCDVITSDGDANMPRGTKVFSRDGCTLPNCKLSPKTKHEKTRHSALSSRNFLNNPAVLPPNGKQGNWTGFPLVQPDCCTNETRGLVP